MWVRKQLDIGWRDLWIAAIGVATPTSRSPIRLRSEASFSDAGDALACLSVRSGFDLLLGTLRFPLGSEVLLSAMTIPDMARIVEHHGLVPVPVDLDLATLGPNPESLSRAVSPASRALVVAHLCGGHLSMGPILAKARAHGLFVIEDCAQAFDGSAYRGDSGADVSMFSFGPIKTATALGGALLRVRDRTLLDRMRASQAEYPIQSRHSYAARVLKCAMLKALSGPMLYGALVWVCRAARRDYDRLVNGSVRGFPGPDVFNRIRQQPSAPLLAMLERRLNTYDRRRLECRSAKGERLQRLLEPKVLCPGREATPHNSWVFPILVENPQEVIAALRQAGFDATQGHSMRVIAPPSDRPRLLATRAAWMLAKTVYLPIYPEMPDLALEFMSQTVQKSAVPPSALGNEEYGSEDRPSSPRREKQTHDTRSTPVPLI